MSTAFSRSCRCGTKPPLDGADASGSDMLDRIHRRSHDRLGIKVLQCKRSVVQRVAKKPSCICVRLLSVLGQEHSQLKVELGRSAKPVLRFSWGLQQRARARLACLSPSSIRNAARARSAMFGSAKKRLRCLRATGRRYSRRHNWGTISPRIGQLGLDRSRGGSW